jgi:choline dehydrogenase
MTPDRSFSSNVTVQMNSASTGSITLRSKDPTIQPLIDPNFLSNPYDKVTMIAAVRAEMRLMATNKMKEHYIGPIFGPKSDSDEDIMVS